jgi:uncharacterized protein YndB with AHSA1/START domain
LDDGVTREVTLPQPLPAVWAALTDGRQLSAWFGARVDMDPSLGGRVTFHWPDGKVRRAVVDAVVEQRLLVLRWLPFEQDPAGNLRQLPAGQMSFVLDETASGTRLRVDETRAAEARLPAGSG